MGSSKPEKVAVKIMLVLKGRYVIGEGRVRLLEEIDRFGCISKAAKALNIPYRVAIRHIRRVEDIIDEKLVITSRGGRGGGGRAELTPIAKDIVKTYKKAKDAIEKALREIS
ncbi:MAG TPA: LysR family transcriptional regulator [Candidatus Korarchaeota archaeon]|nr:LysR family transcriptional regulator [Candidatus Korarchaeota archaeon]